MPTSKPGSRPNSYRVEARPRLWADGGHQLGAENTECEFEPGPEPEATRTTQLRILPSVPSATSVVLRSAVPDAHRDIERSIRVRRAVDANPGHFAADRRRGSLSSRCWAASRATWLPPTTRGEPTSPRVPADEAWSSSIPTTSPPTYPSYPWTVMSCPRPFCRLRRRLLDSRRHWVATSWFRRIGRRGTRSFC